MVNFASVVIDDSGFLSEQTAEAKIRELSLLLSDDRTFSNPLVVTKARSSSALRMSLSKFDRYLTYLVVPDEWGSLLQVIAAGKHHGDKNHRAPLLCLSASRSPSSAANLRREIVWNRKFAVDGKIVDIRCEHKHAVDTTSDFVFDFSTFEPMVELHVPGSLNLVEHAMASAQTIGNTINLPNLSHVAAREEFHTFAKKTKRTVHARYKPVIQTYSPWNEGRRMQLF